MATTQALTLAGELGLSKSGLFAHFHSKQGLQVQTDGIATACACGRPAVDRGRCDACRVEQELFDRELRWATSAVA